MSAAPGSSSSGQDVERENDDALGASRRGFLQIGALVVTGMAGACSPAGGAGGTGGTTGAGGTGGGAGTIGAGGTGGGAGTGGAGTGGLGGTAGLAGTGGTGGTAGDGGTGGTSGAAGTTGQAGMGGQDAGMTGMGWKENNCLPLPALPTVPSAVSIPKLPDPFAFINGMRIASKGDWECLRADLSAKIQAAVYGPKMPPPDSLTATLSGSTVTVNMKVGSKTGSFTFTISGGGSTGAGKPCVIKCDGSGVPFPSSVASISLTTSTFAAQNQMIPTTGLVSTLYGSAAAKSGSDICWAWGASRIIDALEMLPATGIDPKKIAVTGCSYAGKGALAMGVFDERVALTVMQEGGSGGSALWRVSTAEAKLGQNIQEATEIVGEQNWEGADFKKLFSGVAKTSAPVDKLIADQHFAVAICAPRAILLIENDIDWLGPVATYGGGVAGREVYTALGIADRIGVSVAANHGHCAFPSSQQAALTAFINRFLLGMSSTDTSGVDLLNATNSKLKTFNKADWIDWTTPTLSGSLPWDPFA